VNGPTSYEPPGDGVGGDLRVAVGVVLSLAQFVWPSSCNHPLVQRISRLAVKPFSASNCPYTDSFGMLPCYMLAKNTVALISPMMPTAMIAI
jgi:hypothetical protein